MSLPSRIEKQRAERMVENMAQEKRVCPKCGKKWSDFDLMMKGGIKISNKGFADDIEKLVCPKCGADLGRF